MDNLLFVVLLFVLQTIVLYFLSRVVIQELFLFLLRVLRKKSIAYTFLALIFLPGTAVHELSHFFAATALFLPVVEVRILPQWRGNELYLGMVSYKKTDFIRSVIIGIAPFFGACFFYWFFAAFHLFPASSIILNIGMVYLFFAVSSNMFSSKQDLIDAGYLIPLIAAGLALYYLIGTPVHISLPAVLTNSFASILNSISFYITIA